MIRGLAVSTLHTADHQEHKLRRRYIITIILRFFSRELANFEHNVGMRQPKKY